MCKNTISVSGSYAELGMLLHVHVPLHKSACNLAVGQKVTYHILKSESSVVNKCDSRASIVVNN